MSNKSPWWKRLMYQYTPFLFRRCPQRNYHWRADRLCYCGVGINGQDEPIHLR